MKAKIKDHLSRILSMTLIASLVLSLLLAADIFYPTGDSVAFAAESSAIGTSAYTTGVVANGTSSISAGSEYNLGSGAKTNQNGTIRVKCLSKSGTTAVMQTYGVTAGAWPGESDLTSSYSSYWGDLSGAISGVALPKWGSGTGTSGTTNPADSKAVLVSAAGNYSSFGAAYSGAWLGTAGGSGSAYYVYSGGGVYSGGTSNSCVCAPLFNLDLSKVNVSGGTITYATFAASTAIQGTQSITSIEEGASMDLSTLMSSVTYKDGDNAGKAAQYKITINDGTLASDKLTWTAPTSINSNRSVSFTVTDTAIGKTMTGNITVTPRAAGNVSVEKSSGFPESVTVGDSVDLSSYITVTGSDSGSQSDGTITSYSMAISGDYGTISGTTYTPANVSSSRNVTITVTPSGSLGSVDYSALSASFEIKVKPSTTGWTERDEATDELGFHTYKDPSTEITWKYRYNDEGYIVYLYTEDDIANIISDGHVLIVPSSINGVTVVGIGGGSKDTSVIPFVPTSGSKVNNSWTSIYIPSSVKQINDGAFYQNGASADIVVPGNIKTIGVEAFKESRIKSVTFNNAKSLILNTESFADISTLASVAIRGDGVTIKQRAFSNATALTEIDIRYGTKFKGESDQNDSYAFQGTTGLSLVKIDTDTVYSNIFSGNKNLEKVIFGTHVSRVHYDWSGTSTTNASTLSATVDRSTYALNGDTIFEMNKTSGGSPFGYKGALSIVGQGLDLNTAENTYSDTSDPVTAKIAYLEKHYRETEAIKTYAQGSASSITITVEDDPSSNTEVTNTITDTQDGIEAYYDGVIFSGKNLEKEKMTVYKMFGTVQGDAYSNPFNDGETLADFYVIRTAEADALLSTRNTDIKNSSDVYVTQYTDDVIASFDAKDSVTVTADDVTNGAVDVKVIVLRKDDNGNILIDHETGYVKAFTYSVDIPAKTYTAEQDFLENYGSYQAVIDKIDELQTSSKTLAANVTNLESQVEDKDAEISSLRAQISTLEGDKSDLRAQISTLESEKAALTSEKSSLETQLSAARKELADTVAKYAELLQTTEVDASDYTYTVTDPESGTNTDYVLVNGEEATYDKETATEITLSDGTTKVTAYTGTDSKGNEFTFYVAEDGVHVVLISGDTVTSDVVSSDTVSAMQHKIAAELASLKEQLASLKKLLSDIASALNGIGDLDNTDSDYSVDTTKSESEQYKDILKIVNTLATDIKALDRDLTTSETNLTKASADNTKYYNAMVLTYKTLSNENLDTGEVDTVDELIEAVTTKADNTAKALKNAKDQNSVYAYQITDRNLALTDIETLLSGGSASGVAGKITELETLIADESVSDEDKAVYTAQLTELNTYKTMVETVKSKLSQLNKAEEDLAAANQNIETLEGQIATLKGTISSLERTIESNNTTISSLRESVSSLTSENESQAEMISSLETSVSRLETLSSEQATQISSLDSTISAQKEKIDAGTATIEELSAAITTANSQIKTLSEKNAALVSEISNLSATVASLKDENTTQAETISALNEQISTLEENNASLSTQISSLKGAIELSEGEVASLKSTVASLQSELTGLEARNTSQAETIKTLTADLESANTLASQYKMIVDTANTLLGLNLKNTDTKEEVEAAIKEYIATAISGGDTSLDTASANYKAGYNAGVASVDTSVNSTTYKNGYSAGYTAGLSANHGSGTSTDSSTVAALTSQITSLTTTNSNLNKQISTLSSENATLLSKNQTLSSDVSTLKSENSSLSSENKTLAKEKKSLADDNESLESSVTSLKATNKSLKSKNSSLKDENDSLKSENKTLTSTNKALSEQNGTLQSKVNSLSAGSNTASTATAATNNSNRNNSTSGTASVSSSTTRTTASTSESISSKKSDTSESKESEKKSSSNTVIASTPVTTSGTKYENGETVTIKKPSKSSSEVAAEGQEAEFELEKLSGESVVFDLKGASFTDTSEEQLESAYTVINYYLNHISELGDLGSIDIKNIADDKDYEVKANVLASMDIVPSADMEKDFEESGKYTLKASSAELEDGSLYFIVHESEDRDNTFDITLETAKNGELSMELKDLSPVTISKISYEDVTLAAADTEEVGGTTEAITSTDVKKGMDAKRIFFILFGVIAIGGAATMLVIYGRKRQPARS